MTPHADQTARFTGIARLLLLASLWLGGCGSGSQEEATSATQSAAPIATQSGQATASQRVFVPVDACSLLTQSDVQAIAGKPVQPGRREEAGPLVTCSFGDPAAPQVGGRALSQILTLAVMTGQEGAYVAGAVAQAKDTFETGRKNAASAEAVTGLGDAAYWDKVLRKLSVVKGRFVIDIDVESDGDALKVARSAASAALARLPQ